MGKRYLVKRLTLALATAGLAFTAQHSLADVEEGDESFNRRFYIGGQLGVTQLEPRTSSTGFFVSEDQSSGGGFTVGYDLYPRISIEGFYTDLGSAEISESGTGVFAGDVDYKIGGISGIIYLNGRGENTDPEGGLYLREGLMPYVRLGASQLDNASNLPYRQINDWNGHVGLGAEYGWSNGFAARAEFTSYDEDVKMLGVGLVKRFGDRPAPVVAAVEPPPPPPAPVEPPPPPPLDIRSIHFDFDQAKMTEKARRDIALLIEALNADPDKQVVVQGHTDSKGSAKYNQGLSISRARSAKEYLINAGVAPERISMEGFGESRPVATNETAEGRAKNRRVDFLLQ